MLKNRQDAFGQTMYAYFRKQRTYEMVERDDGYLDVSEGPKVYFSEYKDWSRQVREAIKYARGRIIDIGCGAGRHTLYLQKKGHDVLAVDNSHLAIKVCRMRGVKKAKVLSITKIDSRLGVFDTIIMFGNNFGLFGGFKRARWLLRKFYKVTSEQARILAETRDPYRTNVREHLWYHNFNRGRGRMGGQLRIRVRFKKYVTPWFDYLMVSKKEMKEILKDTGWQVHRFLVGKNGMYIAVLVKKLLQKAGR